MKRNLDKQWDIFVEKLLVKVEKVDFSRPF